MIGERIRLARESCRLTQKSLAALSGVPSGTISSIEQGLIEFPSDTAVQKIAKATGFPSGYFYLGPLPDMPEGNFRHKKRTPVTDSRQIRAQVRQVVELVQRAEQHLRLPRISIEPIRQSLSLDEIESLASETRERLGIGSRDPIPNITRAVERSGVIVARIPYVPGNDSFSVWPDCGIQGRPIIVIVGDHPGDRDRANVGHELGHLILHTTVFETGYEKAEQEAWRFAGAILLPGDVAKQTIKRHLTMRVLMILKAKYGCSIALGIRRFYDLGLISHEHYVSLNKQRSARGWRYAEPVLVRNEEPLLIKKIINSGSVDGPVREKAAQLYLQDAVFRKLITPVNVAVGSEADVLKFSAGAAG